MPRFFFNLRNHGYVPDVAGKALADADAARAEAERLAQLLPKGKQGGPQSMIVVTDESGTVVCEVRVLG